MCEREMCLTADKTYTKINPLSTLVPKSSVNFGLLSFLLYPILSS